MTPDATPAPEHTPPCDHKMKSTTTGAMGTDFNVSWCRHCGAFRVRDSKWELPIEGIGQRVPMLEINVEYYKAKANDAGKLAEALEASIATMQQLGHTTTDMGCTKCASYKAAQEALAAWRSK